MPEAHATIGEYLAEHEPVLVLWHHLDGLVGHGESRRAAIETLTEPAAFVYLAGVFEGEVVKGGFRQFLSGPSGEFANATLRALREIGAHASLELLEKALAVFPEGVAPADWGARLADLAQSDEGDPRFFEAFDDIYNRYVDAQSPDRVENINALLLDYMKEHAGDRIVA